ncbi:MAG: hypothetical protein ACRDI0_12655 [Actinomycetota bacterium]
MIRAEERKDDTAQTPGMRREEAVATERIWSMLSLATSAACGAGLALLPFEELMNLRVVLIVVVAVFVGLASLWSP